MDLTARIKPKKSSTTGEVPQASDLEVAELAVNTADGKLFVKHTDNSIKEISGGGGGGSLNDLSDMTVTGAPSDLTYAFAGPTSGTVNYIRFNDQATYTFGGLRHNDNGNIAIVGGISGSSRSTIQLNAGTIYLGKDPATASNPTTYTVLIEATGAGGDALKYRLDPTLGTGTADKAVPTMGQVRDEMVNSDVTIGGTGSNAVNNLVTISQVDYDALGTPDANTVYFIV